MKMCMGRKVVLLLLCLSMALSATGSMAQSAPSDDNLYTRALAASVEKIIKDWGGFRDSDTTRVPTDWKKIVVQAFPEITVGMPDRVGDTHVEYLDEEGLISRYKRVKKPFEIFQIHPMVADGPRVKVRFSLVWFKYKRRTIPFIFDRRYFEFAYSDWSIVYFRLEPETRRFIADEVKLGGI